MDTTAAGHIINFETTPFDLLKINGFKFPKTTKIGLSNEKIFSEAVPLTVSANSKTTGSVKFGYAVIETFAGYKNWSIGISGVYIPESANPSLIKKFMKNIYLLFKNPLPSPVVNTKMNNLGILMINVKKIDLPEEGDVFWEVPFKMECTSFVT